MFCAMKLRCDDVAGKMAGLLEKRVLAYNSSYCVSKDILDRRCKLADKYPNSRLLYMKVCLGSLVYDSV